MKNTTLRIKILTGILCGAMTLGTSVMAQGVQQIKTVATQKAMATTGVTVSEIVGIAGGEFGIDGTGLDTWASFKIYDKNGDEVGCNHINRYNENSMSIMGVYTREGQAGDGVILFFDAYGNQIGRSVISLTSI